MKQQKKLMLPGPVDVWDETLDALSQQVRSNFTEDWHPIQRETIEFLRQIFQTRNDIFILTAPGSGAIEIGAASLFAPNEKVITINNGPFADRAIEILRAYGMEIIEVKNTWGEAADLTVVRSVIEQHPDFAGIAVVANETGTGVCNPVQGLAQLAHAHDKPILVDAVSGMGGYSLPVDDWGLDLLCTSSNKALETPPGLGIVSVSERAWAVIDAKKDRSHRGWYYNLSTWKQYTGGAGGRYAPTTMASSMIVGLHASLKRIIEGETLEGHWARYRWAQKATRIGLRNLGFPMLATDEVASPTVTAVCKREDMAHEQEVREYMDKKHGYIVSGTWGQLTGQAFRVSHMGRASSPEYLIPFLLGIEEYVRTVKEVDVPLGVSLEGIERSYEL